MYLSAVLLPFILLVMATEFNVGDGAGFNMYVRLLDEKPRLPAVYPAAA